jgi:hypothetical protein
MGGFMKKLLYTLAALLVSGCMVSESYYELESPVAIRKETPDISSMISSSSQVVVIVPNSSSVPSSSSTPISSSSEPLSSSNVIDIPSDDRILVLYKTGSVPAGTRFIMDELNGDWGHYSDPAYVTRISETRETSDGDLAMQAQLTPSWSGFFIYFRSGAGTAQQLVDLSEAYTKFLQFSIKTNMELNFKMEWGANSSVELPLRNFGVLPNNQWHHVRIPIYQYLRRNDLKSMRVPFLLAKPGAGAAGTVIVDNIRYEGKTDAACMYIDGELWCKEG